MLKYLLAAVLLAAAPAFADFQVPALTGPVVDNAHILSSDTIQKLETFIRRLYDAGGTQLQILTVRDLGGLEIEEASIKVVDQWKLGGAKEDNGILLMVAQQERKVRIEVGQGREGLLPDVIASHIVRNVITPQFRKGDFDGGIASGVMAIVEKTDPQILSGSAIAVPRKSIWANPELWVFLLFLGVIWFQIWMARHQRRFRRSGYHNSYNDNFYGGSGFGGGGFGGGSSSGGSWGGGGGGFSGGGASGGW